MREYGILRQTMIRKWCRSELENLVEVDESDEDEGEDDVKNGSGEEAIKKAPVKESTDDDDDDDEFKNTLFMKVRLFARIPKKFCDKASIDELSYGVDDSVQRACGYFPCDLPYPPEYMGSQLTYSYDEM